MRIGGFLPQSLIDYPGKIAAVVFTQGCNFRCGYCHNPALVLPKLFNASIDEEEVLQSISQRAGWIDAVVVTGGEPTIHKDLPDFLQRLKKSKLLIKLDTNGTHPQMLKYIIDNQLADYIAMDIKNILTPSAYGNVIGLKNCHVLLEKTEKSIKMLKSSHLEVEFRTTSIPGIHTSETLKKIRCLVKDATFNTNAYREGVTVNSFLKS